MNTKFFIINTNTNIPVACAATEAEAVEMAGRYFMIEVAVVTPAEVDAIVAATPAMGIWFEFIARQNRLRVIGA